MVVACRSSHYALHCVNKQLTLDLFCQLQVNGALCSDNAKGCYERVVHSTASLAMQRAGVSAKSTTCMFCTIQQLLVCFALFNNSSIMFLQPMEYQTNQDSSQAAYLSTALGKVMGRDRQSEQSSVLFSLTI